MKEKWKYIAVVLGVVGIVLGLVAARASKADNAGAERDILAGAEYSQIQGPELQKIKDDAGGEYFILHLWASWCPACTEEFPDFVRFFKENEYDRLKVAAVSFDREDTLVDYEGLLKQHRPNFENYHGHFNGLDDVLAVTGQNWKGQIPATFLYDPEGKLVYQYTGILNFQEFRNVLEKNGLK
jgi:thiol-disulfide isomerase/thioredoxin